MCTNLSSEEVILLKIFITKIVLTTGGKRAKREGGREGRGREERGSKGGKRRGEKREGGREGRREREQSLKKLKN